VRRRGVVIGLVAVLSAFATGALAQSPDDLGPSRERGRDHDRLQQCVRVRSSSAPARFVLAPTQVTLTCEGVAVGVARRIGQRVSSKGK